MLNVKVNQVYVAPLMAGRILRRIRILAPNPDGGWIYQEIPVSKGLRSERDIRIIKEFALEKVFRLETDVCEHKHTDDMYIRSGDHSPSMPNYFKCTDCGDLFPNTGDTALWFPKPLETKVKENA